MADAQHAFNIKVLRRHDPSVLSILDSTSYVVLYRHEEGGWAKEGIEGTLFIVQRNDPKKAYGVVILNRNGTDNFEDDLEDEEDVELTPDFIIFRSPRTDSAYGFWVFEPEHRARIGQRMLDLAKLSQSARKALQPAPAQPVASTSSQSISLDALFGAAAPAPAAIPPQPVAATNGSSKGSMDLLDSLFGGLTAKEAPPKPQSLPPQPPAPVQRQQAPSPIGVRMATPPWQKPQISPGIAAPPPSRLPPPTALQQPLPKARPTRVQGPLVPRMISTSKPAPPKPKAVPPPVPALPSEPEPKQKQEPATALNLLDSVLLSLSSPTSAKSNGALPPQPNAPPVLRSGLSRNEFVREILTLLHTDTAFVDTLYSKYQARS